MACFGTEAQRGIQVLRLNRYQGCEHLEQTLDWTTALKLQNTTSERLATALRAFHQPSMSRKDTAPCVALSSPSRTCYGNALTGRARSNSFQMSGRTASTRTSTLRFGTGAFPNFPFESAMGDHPPSWALGNGSSFYHAMSITAMRVAWTQLQPV